MKSKFLLRLLCLLGVALSPGALPLVHALQFRTIGWAAPDTNLLFDIKGKPVEVAVAPNMFSPAYLFPGEGSLVLYKLVEHEGKVIRQTACTVTIPPGLKQGLLLLVPADESRVLSRKVRPDRFGVVANAAPLAYDYVWFDDSFEARPAGTIQFLNLSARRLALQVASRQIVLPPKASAFANLQAGSKRMNFQGAVQVDGQWSIFSRKPLSTRDPERMLVILREEPDSLGAAEQKPAIKLVTLFDWPARTSPAPGAPPELASSR